MGTSPDVTVTSTFSMLKTETVAGKSVTAYRHKLSNRIQFLAGFRKSKAIPVTPHGDACGCEASRLLYILDTLLTDGGEVVNLTCRPHFTPRKYVEHLRYLPALLGW
jgi:hypothetical protein